MNIIAICGSPRRGNTEFALKRFLTLAETLGHKTELVILRDKKIEHCRGCLSCEESGSCVIFDDMNSILKSVLDNDLIVFGSPNYQNNVSGLMKDFFDRMKPLFKNSEIRGKKVVSVCVGGSGNITYPERIFEIINSFSELFGLDFVGDLYLNAKDERDLENNPEELRKIENFARDILT